MVTKDVQSIKNHCKPWQKHIIETDRLGNSWITTGTYNQ
jgi:hypothetical protein